MSKLKIGLDIHGVISKNPEFFRIITKLLVDAGHEVHIITGGSLKATELELKIYGVHYTHFFSVYDHLISNGYRTEGEVRFPDGTIQKKFIDGVWDRVKGEYCSKMGIDMHIDDTDNYQKFFKTPFCLYK